MADRPAEPVSAMLSDCSIASVTVSHNGATLLPRHLGALLRQTRPLNEIIVVDNASADGTVEMLARSFPQVSVLRLPENLGVGGGFAAGLRYAAVEKHFEWVWLFDSDSVPYPDAAERLHIAIGSLGPTIQGIGMLAAVGVEEQTGIIQWPPLLWNDGWMAPRREWTGPLTFVDFVISSGSLVCGRVVGDIGLPRQDFFMDFVDFEYCLRVRQRGYRIAVVPGSRFFHSLGHPRVLNIPGLPRVGHEYPAWRRYYMARNAAYAVWHIHPTARARLFLTRYVARLFCAALLLDHSRIASLVKMFQGLVDGLQGRLGIRFPNELPARKATRNEARSESAPGNSLAEDHAERTRRSWFSW